MHLDAKSAEMQVVGKKGSDSNSLYSSSTFVSNPTWWNASSANILQSSYSKDLNMNMDYLAKDGNGETQLSHTMSDHDSSTHSSGQSHREVSEMSEDNVHQQYIPMQSGIIELFKMLNCRVSYCHVPLYHCSKVVCYTS